MATTKRTTTRKAPAKKRATTTKKAAPAKKAAARTTARKRSAAPADAFDSADVPPTAVDPVVDVVAEAAPEVRADLDRLALRPGARRAIFFDVENTSRAEDVERVLRHLAIDFAHGPLEFTAVGNWRVIGHEPARQLAAKGAALVHSAPSTGVRDWSDLRIAVAAGVWLAGAVAGDVVEIVSDDQAFDAVGDVAASRGVIFRRLSYRSLAGLEREAARATRAAPAPSAARSPARRRRRGGRGRNGRHLGESPAATRAEEASAPAPSRRAPERVAAAEVETAPVDEVVGVVRDLVAASPGGVTLDDVAAALRSRGFRRRSGSPRLVTRLKLIKEIEVGRDGKIRVVGEGTPEPPVVALDVEDEDERKSVV